MNSVRATERLLEALKVHEKEIGRLYEVYADIFPEYRSFWLCLFEQEAEHADWIEKLQAKIEEGREVMVAERFPLAAIEHSIGYVKELISQAQQAEVELMDALSEALHLEEALSESKYFEVLAGDSDETKHTLTSLANSSREHYHKVRKIWQQNKPST